MRRLLLLSLSFLLAGCDRSLKQEADQIREYSSREDRVYSAEALDHIRRAYWTFRDHAWLGKLPDGSIVRLDAPHASAAPLPSRAFYSGWHLQLTISSEEWRTYPPAPPHQKVFQVVYAITRRSAANWEIDVSSGPVTTPLHREDVALLKDDP